jgi:Uma2 family endonuclease
MSAQPKLLISEEEYLRRERLAEYKSEYYQGEIFPMNRGNDMDTDTDITLAGAREAHSAINANVIAALVVGLRGRKCTVYTSDLRVHIPANSLYTYPDASVVCGKAEMLDGHSDTLLNPMLIVEVLSDSTEEFTKEYDRNGKFRLYRSIPGLREYVLVSQKQYHTASFFLNETGQWVYTDAEGLDGSLHLPSLEIAIALSDAYANVELQAPLNHIQA